MSNLPKITIKRGDDFHLEMTVTNKNSEAAQQAKEALITAQTAYADAIAADPQDAGLVASTQSTLATAQTTYDNSIIVDITGWTIQSHMAWCGKVITIFDVDMLDEVNGVFTLNASSEVTALWTPRTYEADVEFIRPNMGKVSSQTFNIIVEKDVTNG